MSESPLPSPPLRIKVYQPVDLRLYSVACIRQRRRKGLIATGRRLIHRQFDLANRDDLAANSAARRSMRATTDQFGSGWLRKSFTVFTSFFGVFVPKTLPQKPGSLFLDAGFDGRGSGSDTNILDGFSTSFVFVQPRLADWFISDITPCDFFLIRGGSVDHGIDGQFH